MRGWGCAISPELFGEEERRLTAEIAAFYGEAREQTETRVFTDEAVHFFPDHLETVRCRRPSGRSSATSMGTTLASRADGRVPVRTRLRDQSPQRYRISAIIAFVL